MHLDEHRVQVFAECSCHRVVLRNDTDEVYLPDYQVEMAVSAILASISMTDWAAFEETEDRILRLASQTS
jgi:hypothetical protein